MNYKVRKLLYRHSKPRTQPVNYNEFINELSDFMSNVKNPVDFYNKYVSLINSGNFLSIKYILDLFGIKNVTNTNIDYYIQRG